MLDREINEAPAPVKRPEERNLDAYCLGPNAPAPLLRQEIRQNSHSLVEQGALPKVEIIEEGAQARLSDVCPASTEYSHRHRTTITAVPTDGKDNIVINDNDPRAAGPGRPVDVGPSPRAAGPGRPVDVGPNPRTTAPGRPGTGHRWDGSVDVGPIVNAIDDKPFAHRETDTVEKPEKKGNTEVAEQNGGVSGDLKFVTRRGAAWTFTQDGQDLKDVVDPAR